MRKTAVISCPTLKNSKRRPPRTDRRVYQGRGGDVFIYTPLTAELFSCYVIKAVNPDNMRAATDSCGNEKQNW